MLRTYTEVIFSQTPKASDGTPRNLTLRFTLCNSFEVNDTWADLTGKGKITLPKNVFVRDGNNNLIPIGGTQAQKLINNLFQRGDKIQIKYGYFTYDTYGNETKKVSEAFKGFVSKVTSSKPVVLELENNMWLLKQIQCKSQTWPKTKTVEDLMKSLLTGTGFTVNATTQTTIGDLIIQNESIAQLLERLRKDYHLEAYFKGDELRIGSQVYIAEDTNGKNVYKFSFNGENGNIISNKLDFQRKDDVKLSAVCNSMNTVFGKVNKKGVQKSKQVKTAILVYWDPLADNNAGAWKYVEKQKDIDLPPNTDGERRTLFFPNVSDVKTLFDLGVAELQKYYYDGFKGSFETFAIPAVFTGDNVYLEDPLLPDRNGTYRVKGVEKKGGIHGHRQEIMLDYKLL